MSPEYGAVPCRWKGEPDESGSPSLGVEARVIPHLGVPELLIILVIIVLVFGVGKLPQTGKALGQKIREFREGAQALAEADAPEDSHSKGCKV